jgi:hypothetical protein
MPPKIAALPRDHRGYPIPWFVAIDEQGKPDFRIIGRERGNSKIIVAHVNQRCWICGQPRGRNLAFPLGPMCTISGTTPEPPSHLDCATYAARVCPFLARPTVHRQSHGMPEEVQIAGVAIARNPGVIAIWVTRSYEMFQSRQMLKGNSGVLFQIGEPQFVEWYREGRAATPDEIWESIRTGLPALVSVALAQGQAAFLDLMQTLKGRARLIQPEGPLPNLTAMMLEATEVAPPPEVARALAQIQGASASVSP